ncbi:hypothetical protein ACVIGA_001727 [Bradyrhizobium sp. USDA 3240]
MLELAGCLSDRLGGKRIQANVTTTIASTPIEASRFCNMNLIF